MINIHVFLIGMCLNYLIIYEIILQGTGSKRCEALIKGNNGYDNEYRVY
jgi:hypothetical protein